MRGLAEDLTSCAVVGLLLPLGLGGQHRGELQMPEGELDLRLHRLLFFSDGVYAIAVTLLAVELVLPETARNFTGASCSDGGLMWLALFQLLCVAFLPFPTSVVGEHVSDPVAQQFYFGSLLVTGLVMWALWWYMSSGHRSVDRDLSARAIRRHHLISSGVPASILLLMGLVALGVGRFVNALLLAYLVAFGYVVLGVLEHRESLPAEVEEPGGSDDP